VAFERRHQNQSLIVVVPRLIRQLVRRFGDEWLSDEIWENTMVNLPADPQNLEYVNPLVQAKAAFEAGSAIPVGELLRGFPVACWFSTESSGGTP
jgi:maltooligosyltrehalose synthase